MNARSPINSDVPNTEWHASLNLRYRVTERGSRLVASQSNGPLYVQKPFYPEGPDLVHTYILHPPGGVVSGDELTINIDLDDGSQALFTTPGAGRVYRARVDKRPQCQTVRISAGTGAVAEWLPLETIVFPQARAQLQTCISLARGARYIGWDVCCLGLPASKKVFAAGSLRQKLEIELAGKPVLIDTLNLDDDHSALRLGRAGLGGDSALGLMVAGPFTDIAERDMTALIEQLRHIAPGVGLLGISQVGDFITARYLGRSANEARACFTRCWAALRPALIGRAPCEPRIWSC